MKINFKAIITAFIILGCNRTIFAQALNADPDRQEIATPITVARETDIYLQRSVSGTLPESVTILPSGNPVIASASTKLFPIKTTASPASYALTGKPDYLYAITLPTNCIINNTGLHNIIAEKFTSYPTAEGILNDGGMQLLTIGATIIFHSKPGMPSCTSTAAAQVTVNYN